MSLQVAGYTFSRVRYGKEVDLLVKVTGDLTVEQERSLYNKIRNERVLVIIIAEKPLQDETLYERRYYKSANIVYLYGNSKHLFPIETNGFVNYVAMVIVFERNGILYSIREADENQHLVHFSAYSLTDLQKVILEKTGISVYPATLQQSVKNLQYFRNGYKNEEFSNAINKSNKTYYSTLGNVKMDGKNKAIDYYINYDYYYCILDDEQKNAFCSKYYVDDCVTRTNNIVIIPDIYTGKYNSIKGVGCHIRANSELIAYKIFNVIGSQIKAPNLKSKYTLDGIPIEPVYFV